MTCKILITGASGLLGRAIYKNLIASENFTVLGLCHSRKVGYLQPCDLTDSVATEAVVRGFMPNIIIHCAAERRPDVIQDRPDLAKNLNVSATENLCNLAASIKCPLLFISTDYVFDGKVAPNVEDAIPNPLNDYGKSKLDGERLALAASSENIVLRVPVLYGDVEFLEESAVTILFTKVLDSNKPCKLSHYERRYPTHCEDIAFFIRQIVSKKILGCESSEKKWNISGVLHMSSKEEMTKYDMAIAMATSFSLSSAHLIADTAVPTGGVVRPYNTQLSCTRALTFGLTIPSRSFVDGIKDCLLSWLPESKSTS